jgi:hypothetical protein
MRQLPLILCAAATISLAACSRSQQASASSESAAISQIESIPAADQTKYGDARKIKNWQNPYLVIRTDAIGLMDLANNEEHHIKPDEIAQALAKLPSSSWPYGRVIAVEEPRPPASPIDVAAVRKNRAILAGTLEGMHVLIDWIPAP